MKKIIISLLEMILKELKKQNTRPYYPIPKERVLNPDQVRKVRELKESGLTNTQIAKTFQVSCGCIHNIVNGKTYRDVC